MLEIVSACELRPSGVLWRTATGELTLTVVAKATYALQPGESSLAEHQDDPTEYDDHWDDDEARSLRAASDLVPFKARADVILVGRVFAPGGRPARSVIGRMLVAGVDKSVEVFCDRVSRQDGSLLEGQGFVTMPLYWERAAGGPGTANPAGVRADGPRDTYGMLPLPNLQPPGLHVTSHLDFIPPVGFGPIAPNWPARRGRLSARLADWDHRRWHQAPLPADLDPGFFSAAAVDQQVDEIRPDERIVLENLDRDHPRLVTSLVGVTPCLVIESSAATKELGMRCDTLVIDTDRRVCTLTWRAQIPLDDGRRQGRAIITASAAAGRWRDAPATATPAPPTRAPSAVAMPFQGRSAPPAPLPSLATTARGARGSAPLLSDRTLDAPLGDAMPALPFRVGRSPLAGTILGAQPLPAAPPPPIPAPPPSVAPPPFVPPPSAPPPPPAMVAPLAWSPMEAAPSYPPPTFTPPPMVRSEPPPSYAPPAEDPYPPDADEEDEDAEWPPEPTDEGDEDETPSSDPPPEPEPEPLPLEKYPLERCAAIAATLAHGKRERAQIFEDEELDADVWPQLHRHWLDHVRAAEGRGQMGPSARYDDAYVAALEAGRGKMTPKEYARLLVATERGHADETMEELDLPKGAFLRVQRVWLRRTAADADLGKAARGALDEARRA